MQLAVLLLVFCRCVQSLDDLKMLVTFRGPSSILGLSNLFLYNYSVDSNKNVQVELVTNHLIDETSVSSETKFRGMAFDQVGGRLFIAQARTGSGESRVLFVDDVCSGGSNLTISSLERPPIAVDFGNANYIAINSDQKIWVADRAGNGSVHCMASQPEKSTGKCLCNIEDPAGLAFVPGSMYVVSSATKKVLQYDYTNTSCSMSASLFEVQGDPRGLSVSKTGGEVYVGSVKGPPDGKTSYVHIHKNRGNLMKNSDTVGFDAGDHARDADIQSIFLDEAHQILLVASRGWYSVEYFDLQQREHKGSALNELPDQPESVLIINCSAVQFSYSPTASPTPPPGVPDEEGGVDGIALTVALISLCVAGLLWRWGSLRRRRSKEERRHGLLFRTFDHVPESGPSRPSAASNYD